MATSQKKKTKSSKRRKPSPSKTRKSKFSLLGIQEAFNSHRLVFIMGLILIGLAVYATVVVGYFLFTAHVDQSALSGVSPTEVLPDEVNNIGSSGGLTLADFLINRFLGLGSLFLIYFIYVCAIKMMGIFRKMRTNLLKRFVFSVVSACWLSTLAASIGVIWATPFRLGGVYGDYFVNSIVSYLGWFGNILILLVSLIIIAVIVNSEVMSRIQGFFGFGWLKKTKRVKKSVSENDDEPIFEYQSGENNSTGVVRNQSTDSHLEDDLNDSVDENSIIDDEIQPEIPTQSNDEIDIQVAQGDDSSQPISDDDQYDIAQTSINEYQMPSLSLLENKEEANIEINRTEVNEVSEAIIRTLASFKVKASMGAITVGPTVTLYEIIPDSGIMISKITNLEDNISMNIKSVSGIRIIAPIPGKGTIGIEVPNKNPQVVYMKSLLNSKKYKENTMKLPIAIGRTITNDVFMFDLTKMPHLLIAGATGQGKSVGLNVLITSLLYSKKPDELKFVLIDPKMLEFSIYSIIDKHYLASMEGDTSGIITDMNKVVSVLNSLCIEMDDRYLLLKKAGVRKIEEYNELIKKGELDEKQGHKLMPYMVIIIDEFADLIMTSGKEVEMPIARIAQKARAAGIHMVIATQRPSVNVITGIIKANFPARIAFKVFSQTDSKTIIDSSGANQLIGRGDMLFKNGQEPVRLQCAFIDTPETNKIVEHIHAQRRPHKIFDLPKYVAEDNSTSEGYDPSSRDALFESVARMVISTQQGSTSNIQRQFKIGYNRAGRIMDQLQDAGIVSVQDSSKPRQVLVQDESQLEEILKR